MKALLRFLGLADPREADGRELGAGPGPTTIGSGIVIKGEIRGDGSLTMRGHFEGEVVLNGPVEIGPEARVDGNITASAIVIAGVVRGNLATEGRVEIVGSGSLTGSLKSGSLSASDGATVKGEVWVEPAVRRADAGP